MNKFCRKRHLRSKETMSEFPTLRLSRQTRDIELLLPFYRDGLGFEVLDRSENVNGMDTVLLGHKQWPYQFEFAQVRGAEEAPRAPSAEYYRVFCIESDGLWTKLLASMFDAGVPQVTPPAQYVGGKFPAVAYEDADGYRVVLVHGRWKK